MADVYSKRKRSEIMARVRNKRTAPEDAVATILRALKIRYRRNVRRLPGAPDFVVASKRTVVFVNGCFWHGHPNCKRAKLPDTNTAFWTQKILKNQRRDASASRKLRRDGWHVWTVWQCQLRDVQRVTKRLARLV